MWCCDIKKILLYIPGIRNFVLNLNFITSIFTNYYTVIIGALFLVVILYLRKYADVKVPSISIAGIEFNLKNIEEPYKNVSSLNQINTNGTFNLTSDTSGQLTLSDGNTTIYGNNHKIIPNNPNQYFVTINAGQKLTLKNIVIDSNPGFFSDWLYRPAIIVNAGGELILDNCTISKTIQAIKSEGNVTILNSNINNNGRIAHGATIEIWKFKCLYRKLTFI